MLMLILFLIVCWIFMSFMVLSIFNYLSVRDKVGARMSLPEFISMYKENPDEWELKEEDAWGGETYWMPKHLPTDTIIKFDFISSIKYRIWAGRQLAKERREEIKFLDETETKSFNEFRGMTKKVKSKQRKDNG